MAPMMARLRSQSATNVPRCSGLSGPLGKNHPKPI